jgi:hypothetical protein
LFPRIVERTGVLDHTNGLRSTAIDCLTQAVSECAYRRQREWVQQARLNCQNQGNLVGEPHRRMLWLVEDRANPTAPRQLIAHARIRHSAESCEHF